MNYLDINYDKIKLIMPNKMNTSLYIKVYYDNTNTKFKFIIQTPKLKIGYSAKKFESFNSINNVSINYCYSLNMEFAEDFIKFIDNCEAEIIKNINILKKNNPNNIFLKKDLEFNSSLYNPSNSMDTYFKLKLITDKTNNIISTIHLINREITTYESIITNNYADQYIELDGISITSDGQIYLIWYAHQIVITPYEKIYTKKSLIDELNPPVSYKINKIIIDKDTENNKETNKETNKPNIKPLLKIDQNMLLHMKAKLKKCDS
jgi:hypothetical protein